MGCEDGRGMRFGAKLFELLANEIGIIVAREVGGFDRKGV